MHRHSLTYRGAMLNINRYRLRASSCPDIYRNSMTTIAKEKFQWGEGIAEFKALVLNMLDFSYFADIRFVLFALSNFLLYTWYDVPYVYLADNAIEMGFTDTDASLLISLIGIVNMFGEVNVVFFWLKFFLKMFSITRMFWFADNSWLEWRQEIFNGWRYLCYLYGIVRYCDGTCATFENVHGNCLNCTMYFEVV